ncbi:phosphatase PAP2 family protein [Candidatus Margulisiibacteriota bacterium]
MNFIYPVNSLEILKTNLLTIPDDINNLITYPTNHPQETIDLSLLTLSLVATDYYTTDFIQRNINPATQWNLFNLKNWPFFTPEQELLLIGLGSLYGYSLLFDDPKGQAAPILCLKAYVYSYLTTHIFLKSAFARMRPNPGLTSADNCPSFYTKDPWDFGNFHTPYISSQSYGTSFPSFHFTLFFSVARVMQKVYDDYLIPYSLCALFLIPDFDGHHHWTSDMVVGAVIGTIIGDIVTDNYFDGESPKIRSQTEPGFKIAPMFGYNTLGLQLKYMF